MQFYNITHNKQALALGKAMLKSPDKVMDDFVKDKSQCLDALEMISYTLWMEERQPYYIVYPAIIPILTRIKLDIPSSQIVCPMPTLLIRLPIENELGVKTILVTNLRCSNVDIIVLRVEYIDDTCGMTYFEHSDNVTIDELVQKWVKEDEAKGYKSGLIEILKLVCTLCLLGNDPSIIEPDVLDKDRGRYEWGDDEEKRRIEIRAKNRGKIGWIVGASIEKMPHYRRPHLGLRWCGEGRTIPKIVRISGSIVHREIVSKIPTGFENMKV